MQRLWCWRCQQEMPMLDEAEFAEVSRLYREAFDGARHRQAGGLRRSIEERFAAVGSAYERLTGYAGCHHNAVMHHRIALYGPPCASCGKPLRTPQAAHCAACGHLRAS